LDILEIDRIPYRLPQAGDELDIDIGFHQSIAYLLDHGIEGLKEGSVRY
jgi:hypothetical protein